MERRRNLDSGWFRGVQVAFCLRISSRFLVICVARSAVRLCIDNMYTTTFNTSTISEQQGVEMAV